MLFSLGPVLPLLPALPAPGVVLPGVSPALYGVDGVIDPDAVRQAVDLVGPQCTTHSPLPAMAVGALTAPFVARSLTIAMRKFALPSTVDDWLKKQMERRVSRAKAAKARFYLGMMLVLDALLQLLEN